MTNNRKMRLPRINNSNDHRLPNNVFYFHEGDVMPLAFYEDELQIIASLNPDWIIFVKED